MGRRGRPTRTGYARESYLVEIGAGGYVRLVLESNVLVWPKEDRELFFGLVDSLRALSSRQPTTVKPDAVAIDQSIPAGVSGAGGLNAE